MAEGPSRKRSFTEDDDNKPPPQKRIRFPKGKKVKTGDYVVDDQHKEDGPVRLQDPQLVAKERRKRRSQMAADLLEEENRGMLPDITRAEVQYEDDETLVEDGIQIEPFNLTKEREVGFFDAAGNYVEFLDNENEIKDAWLDSIDANKSYAASAFAAPKNEDDVLDFSSDDFGKMKRRIADTLEPGETVLQALRRLKGTSNNRKEKMSAENKHLFDQLTDDAMLLLENGEYNVYDEKQETFQREAEGYEKLAEARMQGTTTDIGPGKSDSVFDKDFLPNRMASSVFDLGKGPSEMNTSASTDNVGDGYDMFGEDDENATLNSVSDGSNLDLSKSSQLSESGDLQNDYVYDESSGYYYSSRLGYYYEPSSGLYCCAASGQWFSYNEESGTYDEIQQAASTVS
ncbi:hypothetical protein ACH5RR_001998 [Cinchona calisaya]|uniref:OCRE domain-containing protein n=1 Tax=Cinchona calisaya TaxID=153742 RepID=A0ABD3B6A8_9GENT